MFKKIIDKIEMAFSWLQSTYRNAGYGRANRRARYAKKYPERYNK